MIFLFLRVYFFLYYCDRQGKCDNAGPYADVEAVRAHASSFVDRETCA